MNDIREDNQLFQAQVTIFANKAEVFPICQFLFETSKTPGSKLVESALEGFVSIVSHREIPIPEQQVKTYIDFSNEITRFCNKR